MTRTILLADDSVTIQKVVELTFMDQDYQIVAVSDGSTAVARLSELKPDLVIADVHMPGADGYEVCRRSKATYPDVPVLLLVGTFEHFDDDAAEAAGAESHLKKPFDSQDLLHQVEALIARAAAAPAPSSDLEPPSLSDDEVTAVSALAFELEPPAPEAEEPSASTPFPLGGGAGEAPSEPVFDDAWGTITPSPSDLEPPPVLAEPLLGEPPVAEAIPEAAPRTAAVPAFEATAFEDPWGVETVTPADEPPPPPVTEPAIEAFTREAPAFQEPPSEPAVEEDAPTEAPPPAVFAEEAAPAVFAEETAPVEMIPEEAAPAVFAEETAPVAIIPEEPIAEEPAELEAPAVEAPAAEVPAAEALYAEPAPSGESVSSGEPVEEEAAAVSEPSGEPATAPSGEPEPTAAGANGLSDADVDRIARRIVEMAGDAALREVAWEVVPDMAEVIIKERIRELESQVE